MKQLDIGQIIIPIQNESLLRWKNRERSIVPEFALNWKGYGEVYGYGFVEWIAEKYF